MCILLLSEGPPFYADGSDHTQAATATVPFARALHIGQSTAGVLETWLHASHMLFVGAETSMSAPTILSCQRWPIMIQ